MLVSLSKCRVFAGGTNGADVCVLDFIEGGFILASKGYQAKVTSSLRKRLYLATRSPRCGRGSAEGTSRHGKVGDECIIRLT